MKQRATLICNGLSAEGYEPAASDYVVTMNGGFTKRRADAAFTVDCPSEYRQQWIAWTGTKVQAKHNAMYPDKRTPNPSELFACEEEVRKYHSATPAVLRWILSKGFTKCLIVGMDALYGNGKPGSEYSAEGHVQFLRILAPRFTDGLYVHHDGQELRVDDEFLERIGRVRLVEPKPAIEPKRADSPDAKAEPSAPAIVKCDIQQNFVEFDVSPKCTRACSFCAPGIPKERRRKRTGLSIKAFRAVIDELVALNFDSELRCVCFCGHGEPLMHTRLDDMIKYARAKLRRCEIAIYTNCDLLTPEFLSMVEAQDARIIADIYDKETADSLPIMVAKSGACPERVLIADHTDGKWHYSSRCQTVDGDAKPVDKPCHMPSGKLFITDDGKTGAAALLCCEDYGRETLKPLTSIADYLGQTGGTIRGLADGSRSKHCDTCAKCDRTDGAKWSGWNCYPKLTDSKYWPARVPAKLAGTKRLVILPVSPKWARHAEVLLDTIDKTSAYEGQSLVIWNASESCPEYLKGPSRIIVEKPDLGMHPIHKTAPFAWTAINVWIGEGFKLALDKECDWAIKMDTDTAILRRGWDAHLLDAGKQGEARGFMLEENVCKWAVGPLKISGAIFGDDILRLLSKGHMRWARGHVDSFWLKGHHLQGGCYAVSREAIRQLDRTGVGIIPSEPEMIIGEDVLFSLRCRVAGIPQRHSPAVCSHYFPAGSYHQSVAKYYRDAMNASLIHPIKDLDTFKLLCGEACNG